MPPRLLTRVAAAADLLRPRTLFRTLARVDSLADTTRDLKTSVEALRIRTEQLEAIARLDWEQQDDLIRLVQMLDVARIECHVAAAIAAAPLELDPFPHLVVDRWLPPEIYEAIVRGLPPAVFFADREESRQRMLVPFYFAPTYSRRVWKFVADEVVGRILRDALNAKFDAVVRDYLASFCPPGHDVALDMHPSDGRIMLRRPGYVIAPHRDPKWGFLTGLIYLARPGDDETHGTKLYRVTNDEEAPSDKPFYIEEDRCELVRAVPFRANSMLVFLNSVGAHGASIPADAKPANLERYVYQFRLGPDVRAIKQLMSLMPNDRRTRWAGAKAQKATAS
jgi:hypothetical protein